MAFYALSFVDSGNAPEDGDRLKFTLSSGRNWMSLWLLFVTVPNKALD